MSNTEPTENWRTRDKIWVAREERIANAEPIDKIRMSKIFHDKLRDSMNAIGDFNRLFGMEVVIDPLVAEDEFVIE